MTDTTLSFEVAAASPEALSLFFGDLIEPVPAPVMSLLLDRTETVSGEPSKPQRTRGLRAWVTGANRKAQRKYEREHSEWVLAGRPTKDITVRTYIPRATLVDATKEGIAK